MLIEKTVTAVGLVIIMMLTALAAGCTPAVQKERPVTYKRLDAGKYRNFLRNWDEKNHPVLYALIQTPEQYSALFHPAPLMGETRPLAPDKTLFARDQILLAARVISNPESMDNVFEIERVSQNDQELTLHYRFHEPGTGAKFSVKSYLAVQIPRQEYAKVIFIENKRIVGELNTARGQWLVPAAAEN